MTRTSRRPAKRSAPRPMTRRGPDGRPHETEEMEQRAVEAEKAEAETPRQPRLRVVGNPD